MGFKRQIAAVKSHFGTMKLGLSAHLFLLIQTNFPILFLSTYVGGGGDQDKMSVFSPSGVKSGQFQSGKLSLEKDNISFLCASRSD